MLGLVPAQHDNAKTLLILETVCPQQLAGSFALPFHKTSLRPSGGSEQGRAALSVAGLRHGRNIHALGFKDARGYGICLLRRDGVAQCLEAWHPLAGSGQVCAAELVCPARGGPAEFVQPSGTPIIHSMKDGAGICVPDGFAALPDNPYSTPIKYDARLVDFSHDSLERR